MMHDNPDNDSQATIDLAESESKEIALLEHIQRLTKELSEERAKRASARKDLLTEATPSRLLIVANRLPMSLSRDEASGEYSFSMSSGGLVSALLGVKDISMVWIGWPGCVVEGDEARAQVQRKLRHKNCEPVFLDKDLVDLYYSGYANNVIWPLFHYIPLPIAELQDSDKMFEAYDLANQQFANVVLREYRPGDLVWVHDYHLMLLPAMLRASVPSMKIGFFLHTPFPSSEIYRILPQREEILRGLLSSDVIGFHIYDYTRHLKSSCTRLLGLDCTPQGVEIGGSLATVGTFPIGIDPKRFQAALRTPQVREYIDELRQRFAGRKVIVGVDRLDYIKGILHKLYALERFLERNPDWVGKVALVQIAVPSRTDVKEYQRLARDTHEVVGRINGRFGSLSDVPIHYLDQSIPFEKMCALYHQADVCLITSLRDGMNLVSYEFVACQCDQSSPGVLILSEFAGAAQSLGAGCILINPWDADQTSQALQYALDMSPEERKEYHSYAINYVNSHSAQYWAEQFITELRRQRSTFGVPFVPRRLVFEDVCTHFAQAKGHRVILVGLVGTLTQKRASGMSYDRFQRFAKCSPSNVNSLNVLARDANTTVVVLTARNREMCKMVLGGMPVWVGAENGLFLSRGNCLANDWKMMAESLDLSWMEEVHRVFDYFEERTPRSFVEKEDTFMSWHYRDADREFGELQARDLVNHLVAGPLVNTSTEVISNSKIVQVRPSGVTKGNMADRILADIRKQHGDIGFAMCIGNFLGRDEDVFRHLTQAARVAGSAGASAGRSGGAASGGDAIEQTHNQCIELAPDAYVSTVNVGAKAGQAKNFVRNVTEVEQLLRRLAGTIAHRDAVHQADLLRSNTHLDTSNASSSSPVAAAAAADSSNDDEIKSAMVAGSTADAKLQSDALPDDEAVKV